MVAAQRWLRSDGVLPEGMSTATIVPQACNVEGPGTRRCAPRKEPDQVDVRIGIVQTPKELEVELGDDADRDKVLADIEEALGGEGGVLWLTDRRGRRVAVPVAKVAYIEVGAPS